MTTGSPASLVETTHWRIAFVCADPVIARKLLLVMSRLLRSPSVSGVSISASSDPHGGGVGAALTARSSSRKRGETPMQAS